jgi:hypothetical protein
MNRGLSWVALALLACLAPAPAGAQEGGAYLRIVEGYAEHALSGRGGLEVLQAAVNTPLAVGDRLSAPLGARVEAVLADGSLVRIGGGSDLVVAALARSQDRADGFSALDLERGELQVARPTYAGPESLEIRLPMATVYLEAPGVYRLSSDGYASAWVTVREGFAELATRGGSTLVRAAETAWLDGADAPRIELTRAPGRDELELWADELDGAARYASVPYVDEALAYSAAPLAEHGGWVEVSGRQGWQPYMHDDWRPYTAGSWGYGPGGLNWISTEPWGWVTSHYGNWDYLPGFGWVWFPGELYSPAWVYWYWGPTHVGWVPAGFYLSAYASYGYVPWSGVYGWVGGSWADYSLWTFCGLDDFGHRGHRGRFWSGDELARVTRGSAIPRGLLATDTRPLTPDVWHDLGAVKTRLLAAGGKPVTAELPDVTRFAVRGGAEDAGRWFESKATALRRAAATRPTLNTGAGVARGKGDLAPPQVSTVRPGGTAAARPTLARPTSPSTTYVRPQGSLPSNRPPVVTRPQGSFSSNRPPVVTRPQGSLPSYRPPVVTRPQGSLPSYRPPVVTRPQGSLPSYRPPVVSRPPALGAPGATSHPVWTRPPASDFKPRPGLPSSPVRPAAPTYPTWIRPPSPSTSGAHDGRPVVQRVLEDIRSGRVSSWRPPAPPAAPSSAGAASVRPSEPQRPSASSKPPSRSSASSRKPPGL